MTKSEPTFFPNWEDDNHCLQAAVLTALSFCGIEASWEEINRETEYEDGLYSWSSFGALALARRISGVKNYASIDYAAFCERGEEYFKEYNASRPDWFAVQKEHASTGFSKEQKSACELVAQELTEERILNKQEIENLLSENVLIALVDTGILLEEDWEAGHFVVVYGNEGGCFVMHDPGLPPRKRWRIPKEKFMAAFKGDAIAVPRASKKV